MVPVVVSVLWTIPKWLVSFIELLDISLSMETQQKTRLLSTAWMLRKSWENRQHVWCVGCEMQPAQTGTLPLLVLIGKKQ